MMSNVSPPAADNVVAIHLFWRATEHGRKLPVQQQGWWYMTRTADGACQDLPVPESFKHDCECMGDVVVLLAELYGHYIDRDQVKNNWPSQSAVWILGA